MRNLIRCLLFCVLVGVGVGAKLPLPLRAGKVLAKYAIAQKLTEQQVRDMNEADFLTILEPVGDPNKCVAFIRLIKGHAINIAGIRVATTANTPLQELMQTKESAILAEKDASKKEVIYKDKKLLLRAKVMLLVQQYFPKATLVITDNETFTIKLPKTLTTEISE